MIHLLRPKLLPRMQVGKDSPAMYWHMLLLVFILMFKITFNLRHQTIKFPSHIDSYSLRKNL
jgi:heme/copper-type cytochrome/quinol oxidase subunit 3